MTMREIAIKAMQEVGYSQARIDQTLQFMDSNDPKLVSESQAPIPNGNYERAMEIARNYFQRNNTLPCDN
jgi:hypothetical protein